MKECRQHKEDSTVIWVWRCRGGTLQINSATWLETLHCVVLFEKGFRNETWVTQIPLPFTLFTVNQVFHSTCYLFPSLSETMHFLMDASRLHHAPAKLSLRLCNPATHSTETSKAFARLPLSFPSQAPRGDGHAQHWRLSSLSSIFSFQYTINLCVHQRHI